MFLQYIEVFRYTESIYFSFLPWKFSTYIIRTVSQIPNFICIWKFLKLTRLRQIMRNCMAVGLDSTEYIKINTLQLRVRLSVVSKISIGFFCLDFQQLYSKISIYLFILLYKLQVYNIIILHLYTLQNDHPPKCSYWLSPWNWPPFTSRLGPNCLPLW